MRITFNMLVWSFNGLAIGILAVLKPNYVACQGQLLSILFVLACGTILLKELSEPKAKDQLKDWEVKYNG